ncbi:2-C-methyl-D-erythritol 2,4-cyclodiphosphate synthase [Leptolyngbya sp. 15MV]|nr:2-C-methyl-D-erythritol 2,4-cyclodiphosphate synthase [Leptolyngbya sp. 15MV]
MFRIGFGNDIHRLEVGIPLTIGGIQIESELGAVGHSDADVLFHAVTDAILGALALGDIGTYFPNTDPRWKNANSRIFIEMAFEAAQSRGFSVINLDSTINLEAAKLRPYLDEMRSKLAEILQTNLSNVSVKAKTGEGVGAVGKNEAVTAEAVVLLAIDRAAQE